MKAMILCAGRGERMRPLTNSTPKPLLKVCNKALVVWHIEKLVSCGFKEIVINIAHLGYKIPQALGDGSAWGINISYSDEQDSGALESAGGIKKALHLIGKNTFLVVNGDIFCNYDFDVNFKLKDKLAHLVLVPNPQHNKEGDFNLKDGVVTDDKNYTFSGIGYYHPDFFADVEIKKAPLAPLLRQKMQNKLVSGEFYDGIWHDIGTPQRLKEVNERC